MEAMTTDVQQRPPVDHRNSPAAAGATDLLADFETFVPRHNGPSADDIRAMLATLGPGTLEELVERTVPASIRLKKPLHLGPPRSEWDVLTELREIAQKNQVVRSFIGQGYYETIVPPVIQRN